MHSLNNISNPSDINNENKSINKIKSKSEIVIFN